MLSTVLARRDPAAERSVQWNAENDADDRRERCDSDSVRR